VARVYRELQSEGLLRLERGVGTFVGESLGPVLSKTDLRRIEDKAVELIRLARRAGIGVSELSQLIESRWQEVDHVQS
jgi:DNA-binding transcriptional regulator YhcF (GntR family)